MRSVLNNPHLRDRMIREGLLDARACTPQENERFQGMLEAGEALPEGVFRTDESAYEFLCIPGGLPTPEEERNLMMALQTQDIKTIRNWVIYFGVLSVISAFIALVTLMN